MEGNAGLPIEEGHYGIDAVMQADECFITNTGMEVMPVTQIGLKTIGPGKAGPVALNLWKALQKHLPRYLGPALLTRAD